VEGTGPRSAHGTPRAPGRGRVRTRGAVDGAARLLARVSADPGQITVLVAEAGERLLCTAWALYHPGTDFVALLGGTTLPVWRGRGLYRAMIAARAREAAARGVRLLHVDASPASAPILRRCGFHEITTSRHYRWTPPERPAEGPEKVFGPGVGSGPDRS
jgi:GNAT superfamily N-acetyltransferase